MNEFVFVTGIGRSGTSTVARILHQNGIVCMGHDFPLPDEFNPQGYWEDLETRRLGRAFLYNDWEQFVEHTVAYHKKHKCTATRLGFKHPGLVTIPRSVWQELRPKALFICTRTPEQVILSLRRKRERKKRFPELAADFYVARCEAIKTNVAGLSFVYDVDFSEYRTDEWVLQKILLLL